MAKAETQTLQERVAALEDQANRAQLVRRVLRVLTQEVLQLQEQVAGLERREDELNEVERSTDARRGVIRKH